MLVDVVEMRCRGVRIAEAQLKIAQRHRGMLSLSPDRPGRDPRNPDPPLLAGLIAADGCAWILPPLDKARVTKINGRGMLIRGRQELRSTRSSRASEWFDQTWWVRVVAPAAELAALQFEDVQSVHLAN